MAPSLQNALKDVEDYSPTTCSHEQTSCGNLTSKLEEIYQEHRWKNYDYAYFLSSVGVAIISHEASYGRTPTTRGEIIKEVAILLAKKGLPTRTDHRLVDPSGELNRREDATREQWRQMLEWILPTKQERIEVGLKAIEHACRNYLEQSKHSYPHARDEATALVSRLRSFKVELEANPGTDNATAGRLLQDVLPSLVYHSCDDWIFYHFPDAFADPKQVLALAEQQSLSLALEDVRVRWYGDSGSRFQAALRLKNDRKIPTIRADQDEVLHYICENWGLDREEVKKIAAAFNLAGDEVRAAMRDGISKSVSGWNFERLDLCWYTEALKQVEEILEEYAIAPAELQVEPAERLPGILASGDLLLVEQYLQTFRIDREVLLNDQYRTLTAELLRRVLDGCCEQGREASAEHLTILSRWEQGSLRDLTIGAIYSFGNDLLAQSDDGRFGQFRRLLQLEGDRFQPSHFREGSQRRAALHLRRAEPHRARAVASEYGFDLKNQYFQAAAIDGICWIFQQPQDGRWNYQLFKKLTEACGIHGRIDNQHIRDAVRSTIISDLNVGDTRALTYAEWLHDKFAFRDSLSGQDLELAGLAGFRGALRDGNGFGMRFITREVCRNLDPNLLAQAVREACGSDAGLALVVENLRYIPEAVLNKLNRDFGFADYQRDLGVAGPITYGRYMKYRNTGREVELKGYVQLIRKEMEQFITCDAQDVERLQSAPHYRELLITVYPNNWGPEASFEAIAACADRSMDLAQYKIRKEQRFTLAEGVEMRLKAGEELYAAAVDLLQDMIDGVMVEIRSAGFSQTAMRKGVARFAGIGGAKGTENAYPCALFARIMEAVKADDRQKTQELLLAHRLAEFQNARNYMRGTRAHVEESKNADYVNMLELQDFLGDQMRESISSLVSAALSDEATREAATSFCSSIAKEQARNRFEDIANRNQLDKLGLSASFRRLVQRQLKSLQGQDCTADEVDAIIASCEHIIDSAGSGQPVADLPPLVAQKIVPLVRSQRERSCLLKSWAIP